MHIVAQLRPIDLHNFLGQIPESSQFLGASKLPLLEWTSPNARSLTHTYSVLIYPLTKACVSYLSAMILLFFDPQFIINILFNFLKGSWVRKFNLGETIPAPLYWRIEASCVNGDADLIMNQF